MRPEEGPAQGGGASAALDPRHPAQPPPGPQQGEDGRQGEGGMVGIRPGHQGHGVNRTRKGDEK